MVVTITMTRMAEKTVSSRILSPLMASVSPMPTKISPTSPRGIMPRPIDKRFRFFPKAPSPHACFPTIAATVRAAARPMT